MLSIPWTQVESLEVALEQLIATAVRFPPDTLPFRLGGEKQAAIEQRSSSLETPIPEPIRKLFSMVRGFESPHDCERIIFLWDLSEVRWVDPPNEVFVEEECHQDWLQSKYLAFGQSLYGDTLVYALDPPIGTPGSILCLDHEEQGPRSELQPPTIVFYADNLAQWLSRWTFFEFEEFGFMAGEIMGLRSPVREQMAEDHKRLNQGEGMNWLFEQ